MIDSAIRQEGDGMNPHYYLMKSKKILRLEAGDTFDSLPLMVQEMAFDPSDVMALDQDQANWRVAIFRDEIMEFEEFNEWLGAGNFIQDEEEFELIAN